MKLAAENSPNLMVFLALWQLDIRYSRPSGMVCRAIFVNVFYLHPYQQNSSDVSAKLQAQWIKNSWNWGPKTAQIWWFCGPVTARYPFNTYGHTAVRRSIDVKHFLNNRSTRYLWRFCKFLRPRNKNSLTWVPKTADICGGFAGWFWPNFRYLRHTAQCVCRLM